MLKESAHAGEVAIPINDQLLLIRIKFMPGYVQWNFSLPRESFELGKQGTIFRFGPRLDCALIESLALVGNHEVEIEVDRIAKTLTARTSAVRIVEREQPWLRFIVSAPIILTLEALREAEPRRRFSLAGSGLEGDLTSFAVSDFDGVYDPRARIGGDRKAIDKGKYRFRKVDVEQGFRRREFKDLPTLKEAIEATFAQIEQTSLHRIGERRGCRGTFLFSRRHLCGRFLLRPPGRLDLEPHPEPRGLFQPQDAVRGLLLPLLL